MSSATELAQIKAGNTINLRDAFLGLQSGCIGEVCTLAILIGFAYLLIRKVISPRIPLIYMASTVVFVVLFALVKGREMDQVIYAILIGFLTAIFRVLGSSAEGVSYAIIISNLVVPLIEKITVPKAFGMRKKEEA